MLSNSEGRGVIRLGDTTSHGGRVISVARTYATDMDKPIACIGDMVQCPRCRRIYPIVEGDPLCTIDDTPIAFEGHKTACGAVLISSVKS